MFWRYRKIRVTIAIKRKEANMSETERIKDKDKGIKSIKENTKSLSLKQNKPERPQRLPSKTGYSHHVRLPTYEESQAKYEKFLCSSNTV